jgi:adenylosuccinate synthase
MKSSIIVDLSFGDGGKGRTVDYLCKNSNKSKIVIRFSGGQQCGHHVMNEFGSHTHSNFGSGTLRGIESYFTEHCTIYPLTIWNEYSLLINKYKLNPFINVHPLSLITTPYDVAFNQKLEKLNNHGSCGLGVGSTMKRNIESGYKLYAIDSLRVGNIKRALHELKILHPEGLEYERYIPDYKNYPNEFKLEMENLAEYLESFEL